MACDLRARGLLKSYSRDYCEDYRKKIRKKKKLFLFAMVQADNGVGCVCGNGNEKVRSGTVRPRTSAV